MPLLICVMIANAQYYAHYQHRLACSKLISMQVPLHHVGVPFLLPIPLAPPTPHTMPHPLLTVESLVLMIINHFSLLLPLTPPTGATQHLTNMIR